MRQGKGTGDEQNAEGDGQPEFEPQIGEQTAEKVELKGELAGFLHRNLAVFAAFHEQSLVILEEETAFGGQRANCLKQLFRFVPVHFAVCQNRCLQRPQTPDRFFRCHIQYYIIFRRCGRTCPQTADFWYNYIHE